jgi:hypothetical protein
MNTVISARRHRLPFLWIFTGLGMRGAPFAVWLVMNSITCGQVRRSAI